MRRICLLLLSTFYMVSLNAQRWEVFGVIRNDVGEGVEGASVYLNDSVGVISGDDGLYKLSSDTRPEELIVQHLSHFSRRIPLEKDSFQERSLRLDIALMSQFRMLPAVDIVAPKLQTLLEENFNTDIYDYEFAGENLLLLLRERKRYMLRMVSETGEALSEMALDGNPCRFHRSCTGGLHVVGNDFSQEISIYADQIDTFARYSAAQFLAVIEPCILKNERYYIYRRTAMLQQVVRFFYYDTYGGKHHLTDIWSPAAIDEIQAAYEGFFSKKRFSGRPQAIPGVPVLQQDSPVDELPEAYDVPVDIDQLLAYAETADQLAWLGVLNNIERRKNYVPLFKKEDKIYIFDHLHGDIRVFDDFFRKETKIPITYHLQKGWQKELLKDDFDQSIYAHFTARGQHQLQKIELSSGAVTQVFDMEDVVYLSEKFKIRDGYLYFLGQADVNIPNKKLFKVHIAQQQKK